MRWQKSVWFKAIAIALIISCLPIHEAAAISRERRGGNDFFDLFVAFMGGVAKPLSATLQAQMAGTVGSAAYNDALNAITIRGMWGNLAKAAARLAGADQHTAGLLGAIVGGFAAGIYGAGQSGGGMRFVLASVVASVAAFEVGYWLSQAGVPVAGLLSALTGALVWGVLSGQGFGGGQLLRAAIAGGVADAITIALTAAVGKKSPARAYIGNIAWLIGGLAGGLIVPQMGGGGGGGGVPSAGYTSGQTIGTYYGGGSTFQGGR